MLLLRLLPPPRREEGYRGFLGCGGGGAASPSSLLEEGQRRRPRRPPPRRQQQQISSSRASIVIVIVAMLITVTAAAVPPPVAAKAAACCWISPTVTTTQDLQHRRRRQQQQRRITHRAGRLLPSSFSVMEDRRSLSAPASTTTAAFMRNGGDDNNDDDMNNDSKFQAFASSMLSGDNDDNDGRASSSSAAAATTRKGPYTATSTSSSTPETWKRDLDELLNVSTPNSKRQVLLQRLLSSNQDIRSSVERALRERTIDPLLTPQTKKIQDGTRAVARQVTSDILPSLAQRAAAQQQQQRQQPKSSSSSSSSSSSNSWLPAPPLPLPPLSLGTVEAAVADVSKVGDRLLNLAQRQFQRGLDEISRDLADPRRIPDRVVQQASDLVQETLNVFAETPVNLKEPNYRVVMATDDYEVRDYDGYRVASTRTSTTPAPTSSGVDGSWAQDGAAFATLASYVLGGNEESRVLEMTTPVTTTMTGEMRFYLALSDADEAPMPSAAAASSSTSAVEIQMLPPARLAVRKFPGFVTDGEVSRQKSALLTALELDGIELDVRHGQTVPHVIFQYNPPYTVPVLRRNEIAVPVVGPSDQVEAELRNGESTLGDDFWSGDE